MPTLPTPFEEHVRDVWHTLRLAVKLLFRRPALPLLALAAWGVQLIGIYEPNLTLIEIILTWLFVPLFFGAVAVEYDAQGTRPSRHSTLRANFRLIVGFIAVTMFYTLPLLLLFPIIAAVLPLDFRGQTWVPATVGALTAVPIITAMWSLSYRRNPPVQALQDGLFMWHRKWRYALLLGVLYQTLALLTQRLHRFLAERDVLLTVIAVVLWAGVEAIFRLSILLRLFPNAQKRTSP